MSQIITKFITDDAVTETKIRLANDSAIRARNAGDSADINIIKLNSNDDTSVEGTNIVLNTSNSILTSDAADIQLRGEGLLKFYENDNTSSVTLKAPASLAGDYTLTLPADDGASGEVLSTNGSGVLSWVSAGGGGSTWAKETFTLVSGDITAQKVTVANTPIAASVVFTVKGAGALFDGGASPDYSVSGSDINFLNDLATGGAAALVAGDIVQVQYQY